MLKSLVVCIPIWVALAFLLFNKGAIIPPMALSDSPNISSILFGKPDPKMLAGLITLASVVVFLAASGVVDLPPIEKRDPELEEQINESKSETFWAVLFWIAFVGLSGFAGYWWNMLAPIIGWTLLMHVLCGGVVLFFIKRSD